MKGKARGTPRYDWLGLGWARRPDDREIRTFLLDLLRENPLARWEEIRVRVERGVVTSRTALLPAIAYSAGLANPCGEPRA